MEYFKCQVAEGESVLLLLIHSICGVLRNIVAMYGYMRISTMMMQSGYTS